MWKIYIICVVISRCDHIHFDTEYIFIFPLTPANNGEKIDGNANRAHRNQYKALAELTLMLFNDF